MKKLNQFDLSSVLLSGTAFIIWGVEVVFHFHEGFSHALDQRLTSSHLFLTKSQGVFTPALFGRTSG